MFGGSVSKEFKDAMAQSHPTHRGEHYYRAVLKKRIGQVTADEFLQLAHRFIAICKEEYGTYHLECFQNWLDGVDTKEKSPEKLINLEEQTLESFESIFASSRAMKLCVSPTVEHDNNKFSFTCMEWEIIRPRAIEFYAQTGGITYRHGNPLCYRLLERMFPTRYPAWNWVAKIGVDAVLRERYGW